MATNDIDLGKWIATTVTCGTSIKQFENGFSIKKRGESITHKIKYLRKTTSHDMSEIVEEIMEADFKKKYG